MTYELHQVLATIAITFTGAVVTIHVVGGGCPSFRDGLTPHLAVLG